MHNSIIIIKNVLPKITFADKPVIYLNHDDMPFFKSSEVPHSDLWDFLVSMAKKLKITQRPFIPMDRTKHTLYRSWRETNGRFLWTTNEKNSY